MRHGYVVFDNDAALFICTSKEQAEAVLKEEKARLEKDLIGGLDSDRTKATLSPAQITQERQRATMQLNAHYLHYHIVPFAPALRSEGKSGIQPERDN